MSTIPNWLESYSSSLKTQNLSASYSPLTAVLKLDGAFLCPCCRFPTLGERAGYEICMVCWWEDDGQDDHNADTDYGGPNSGYSLTEARQNFLDHFHMYARGKGIEVVLRPSKNRLALLDYIQAVISGNSKLESRQLNALLENT